MNEERELRAAVLLYLQRALLGAVSPALRSVSVVWREKTIEIFSYFDGEISEVDEESMRVAETEVIADFPEDYSVTMHIERLDVPSPIPHYGTFVYRRRENNTD